MFIGEIKADLKKITGEDVSLEHPADLSHGDYSTNIALVLAKKEKRNPRELADEIVKKWRETGLPDFVEKIEAAGAGFLNIWLKFDALVNQTAEVLKEADSFGKTEIFKNKTFLLEHTSPNTNKSLHVGHVRNNVTGMAISRILEFNGAKVIKDCLFNDRGIHICKAMWGYLRKNTNYKGKGWKEILDRWFEHQDEWPKPEDEGEKPDHFVEKFYGLGVNAEEDEGNKREIQEILLAWEDNDEKVRALWKKLNDWVYQGFEETFRELGSRYDHGWYESGFYQQAKETVKEGLEKGVFKRLDGGAILTNLEAMGLTDTIVQRADGTSMYFTQDIYLTKQKTEKFPADKYIWVVGPEQQLHLKQVFAVCEQLGIGKREFFLHLWYGFVYLKGKGKMSSRRGTVISADELLLEARRLSLPLIKEETIFSKEEKEKISAAVGTGAVKYGLLKLGRTQDIYFDWEESLSLKGNSGPYLQYTYARTQSVLTKSQIPNSKFQTNPNFQNSNFSNEEMNLLRTFYRFPEIVEETAKQFSPNIICNFLFDLAQKFNLFYDKQRIIGSGNEDFRLVLTASVGQVLKNGLTLLGIEPLNRM